MISRWKNIIILILLGAELLRLSWDKWANITLNYGRELYTPWRITHGAVLYKDIASLYGPFPPYFNALLFKVFGVSMMTLNVFNILIVAGITLLVYKFFSHTMDQRVALFAGVTFLVVAAFNQSNGEQGLFSYICPYSYSVTYAIFFSLAAIDVFAAYLKSNKDYLLGLLGILIGLTALCRFETFIFLAMALFLGLIIKGSIGQWPLHRLVKSGVLIVEGFFIPVSIAYVYFYYQLPHAQVLSSILGFNDQWQKILGINYYQHMTGLDHPWHNFILMWIPPFNYQDIFRCLPLIVILVVGRVSWILWRHHREEAGRTLSLWVMAIWGLLMLSKVFLNVQINSEGFFFALPGLMLAIVFFQGFVPQYFERLYPKVHFIQILVSVLIVLILFVDLRILVNVYQSRNFSIHAGSDKIICNIQAHPENAQIADFIENADKIMGKNANFVAFPDGAMLNFLTGRINPLPYNVFKPTEIVRFGEQQMLGSFIKHKPDYVVLSNWGWQPTLYPGSQSRSIYPYMIKDWILAHYYPVWPLQPSHSGLITVLKRSE